MAKNSNGPQKRGGYAKRFNDVKWINWSLSNEQKQTLKAWVPTVEEIDDWEIKLIQSNHKITTSYDKYGDCYTTSVVPTEDNTINSGFILTGKGSTPLKSLKQAVYIHFTIFEGDWSSYSTATGKEEMDD